MFKNRSISFKLILSISLSGALVLLILFGYNYSVTKKIVLKNLRENARNLALATVNNIDGVLKPVERMPESLARYFDRFEPDSRNIFDQLKSVVENPEIYGSAMAFQPYAFLEDSLYYAPYVYTDGDSIKTTFLGGENYQYFYMDWYQLPAALEKPVWSEPYFDEGGGGIVMSTYSVPFYSTSGGHKSLRGIITADISLEWLQEIVDSIKIYESGYGFLISGNGTFVTYPDSKYIMNETIISIAEAHADSTLLNIGAKMIAGESGFIPIERSMTEHKAWLYYTPLRSSGWSLGVIFPENELMGDFNRLSGMLIILGVAGLVMLSASVFIISVNIIKPLKKLATAAGKVGAGDLDFALPQLTSRDEVGRLYESFSAMVTSLNEYIHELTKSTAERERFEQELKIANDIQMSIIPRTFPPFPDKKEFGLYAYLKPAKEVGGDYYDFFFVDEDNLCFAIGDVSGSGVPAALIMAVTRTLIRSRMTTGLLPAEVLRNINNNLVQDNASSMFVSLFMGIFNIKTGVIKYSNAGHNVPLVINSDGTVNYIGESHGKILGIESNYSFENFEKILHPGDLLFMYTDGVNEAENAETEMYSMSRLINLLQNKNSGNPEEITKSALKDVKDFTAGENQSDDITIMVLKYNG